MNRTQARVNELYQAANEWGAELVIKASRAGFETSAITKAVADYIANTTTTTIGDIGGIIRAALSTGLSYEDIVK